MRLGNILCDGYSGIIFDLSKSAFQHQCTHSASPECSGKYQPPHARAAEPELHKYQQELPPKSFYLA